MKIKVGLMGSAGRKFSAAAREKASALGQVIASRELILLTGATSGLPYLAGKAAHGAGALHIGISPAVNASEHEERYRLPTDACDTIIYTGFGLKGRNVVLVRSCDIALFIAGSIGSLNEFTIAYDEGKIIGCLTGTGGVADEAERIVGTFQKRTKARIFYHENPVQLLEACLSACGGILNRER